MSKKKTIILVLSVIALIIWGLRVYHVNEGVAKTYEIKAYQLGDKISLDNATFTVKTFSYGALEEEHGYKSVPLSVEMQVKNTSDKDIPIIKIIETKLAYGIDSYQTRDGEFDVGDLRHLPPNKTTNITLLYHVRPKKNGEDAMLYINQNLYGKRVMDKYQEGKRFGIAIELEAAG